MRSFVRILGTMDRWLISVERWLIAALFMITIGSVLIQVLCRYVLHMATPWSDEVGRFSFIWLCWVSAGFALAQGSHINIDAIDGFLETRKSGPAIMKALDSIALAVSIVVLAVFLYFYWGYYQRILRGTQFSLSLRLPYYVPMASVIAGTVLMIIHGLYKLIPNSFKTTDAEVVRLLGDKPQD